MKTVTDVVVWYFAPLEVASLSACAEADYVTRFTERWTLTEAYVKARGVGIGVALDAFAFRFSEPAALAFCPEPARKPHHWQFVLAQAAAEYRLAVAAALSARRTSRRIAFVNASPNDRSEPQILRQCQSTGEGGTATTRGRSPGASERA